jgi:hypothetical protein
MTSYHSQTVPAGHLRFYREKAPWTSRIGDNSRSPRCFFLYMDILNDPNINSDHGNADVNSDRSNAGGEATKSG